jgi:hypothetical protein
MDKCVGARDCLREVVGCAKLCVCEYLESVHGFGIWSDGSLCILLFIFSIERFPRDSQKVCLIMGVFWYTVSHCYVSSALGKNGLGMGRAGRLVGEGDYHLS